MVLTPDQLARDLFAIITASIHSTSSVALVILFDMLEHPEELSDIRQEVLQIQSKLERGAWTRKALGDLRMLDNFMRESARIYALTQCK
jgi:cytochrome P450